MSNLISIEAVRQSRIFQEKIRKVDAQASFTILELCLEQLKLNNMKELEDIKKQIHETMGVLYKIGKND